MQVAYKTILDPKYRVEKILLHFEKLTTGEWECELRYDGSHFYVKESTLTKATEAIRRKLEDR